MTSPDQELIYTESPTLDTLEKYRIWVIEQFSKRKTLVLPQDVTFVPMAEHADSDYQGWIKQLFIGYYEVKCRRNTKDAYLKTKIPLRKHSTAEHYWRAEQKRSFFLCRWTDCIGRINLWEEPDEVTTMVARHDRGGAEDVYALYKVERALIITNLEDNDKSLSSTSNQ